ncbi:MAG TPA: hypothetical protein VMG30_03890 [Acidobacteriota bacterium]|nr:hypothetical protein [Acidobacteriota bacterium]
MNLQRLTLLAAMVAAWAGTLSADDAERVMILEVQLNGVTLSKTDFKLFDEQRGTIAEEPQKTLSFSFKPEHAILWLVQKGVTVTPVQTKPNQVIECSISIWRPDSDSVLPTISASFSADDRILMRAIHIADPKKRVRSEIATGLVLWTYPPKREK